MLFTTRKPRREANGESACPPPPSSLSSPHSTRFHRRKKEKTKKKLSSPPPKPFPDDRRADRGCSPQLTRRRSRRHSASSSDVPASSLSPLPPVLIDLCSDQDENDAKSREVTDAHCAGPRESKSPARSPSPPSCALFPAYAARVASQRLTVEDESPPDSSFRSFSSAVRDTEAELSVSGSSFLIQRALGEAPATPDFGAAVSSSASALFGPSASSGGGKGQAAAWSLHSPGAAWRDTESAAGSRPAWLTVGKSFTALRASGGNGRALWASSGAGSSRPLGLLGHDGDRDPASLAAEGVRETRRQEEQSLLEMKFLLGRDEETLKRRSRRRERQNGLQYEDLDLDSVLPPPSSVFSAEDFDELAGFGPPAPAWTSAQGVTRGRQLDALADTSEAGETEASEDEVRRRREGPSRPQGRETERRRRKGETEEGVRSYSARGGEGEQRRRGNKRCKEGDSEEDEAEQMPALRLFSFTLWGRGAPDAARKAQKKETEVDDRTQRREALGKAERAALEAGGDGMPYYERVPFIVSSSSPSSPSSSSASAPSSSVALARLARASGRPSRRPSSLRPSTPLSVVFLPVLCSSPSAEKASAPRDRASAAARRGGGEKDAPAVEAVVAPEERRERLQGAENEDAGLYSVAVTFDVEGADPSGREKDEEKAKEIARDAAAVGPLRGAGEENADVELQVEQLRQRLHLRCRRVPGDVSAWISQVAFEPAFLFFSRAARSAAALVSQGCHRQLSLLHAARVANPIDLHLLFLSLLFASLEDEPARALYTWRRALLQLPVSPRGTALAPAHVRSAPRALQAAHSAGAAEGAGQEVAPEDGGGRASQGEQDGERGAGGAVAPCFVLANCEGRLWLEHFLFAVGVFDMFSVSAARALAGDLLDILHARRAEGRQCRARGAKEGSEVWRSGGESGACGRLPSESPRMQIMLGGLMPCELLSGHASFAVRLLQALLHVGVYAASLGAGGRVLGLQQLELAFASSHNLHFGDPCAGYLLLSTRQLSSLVSDASSLSSSSQADAASRDGAEELRLCEAVDEWVASERRRLREAHARGFSFLEADALRRKNSRRDLGFEGVHVLGLSDASEGGEGANFSELFFTFFLQQASQAVSLFDWFLAAEEASSRLAWCRVEGDAEGVERSQKAESKKRKNTEEPGAWCYPAPSPSCRLPPARTPVAAAVFSSLPVEAVFSLGSPRASRGDAQRPDECVALKRLCFPREDEDVAGAETGEGVATAPCGERGECAGLGDECEEERKKARQRDVLLSGLDALASPSLHRFCSNHPRAIRAAERTTDARLLLTLDLLLRGASAPQASSSAAFPIGSRRDAGQDPSQEGDGSSFPPRVDRAEEGDKTGTKAKKARRREGHPGALFGSWWPDSALGGEEEEASFAATLAGAWRCAEERMRQASAWYEAQRGKKENDGEATSTHRRLDEIARKDADAASKTHVERRSLTHRLGAATADEGSRDEYRNEEGKIKGGGEDEEGSAAGGMEKELREGSGRTRAQLIGLLASQALLCLPRDPLVAYCVMAACRSHKVTKTVLRLFPASPGLWLAYASSLYHTAFQQPPRRSPPPPWLSSPPATPSASSESTGVPARKRERNAGAAERSPLAAARRVMLTCCAAFTRHLPLAASWVHLELLSKKSLAVSTPPASAAAALAARLSASPQDVLRLCDALASPLDGTLATLCWTYPLLSARAPAAPAAAAAAAPASGLAGGLLVPWEGAGVSSWAVEIACCAAEESFASAAARLTAAGAAQGADRPPAAATENRKRAGEGATGQSEAEPQTATACMSRSRLKAAKLKFLHRFKTLLAEKQGTVSPAEEQEFPLFSSPLFSCVYLLCVLSAALAPSAPGLAVWRLFRRAALPVAFALSPELRSSAGVPPPTPAKSAPGPAACPSPSLSGSASSSCRAASLAAAEEANGETPSAADVSGLPFLAGVSDQNLTGVSAAAEAGARLYGEAARCLELLFTFLLALLLALRRSDPRGALPIPRNRGRRARRGAGEDDVERGRELGTRQSRYYGEWEKQTREEDVLLRAAELSLAFFPRNRLFLAVYVQHFRRCNTDAFDVRHRLLHLLRVPFLGLSSSPWPSAARAPRGAPPTAREGDAAVDRDEGRNEAGGGARGARKPRRWDVGRVGGGGEGDRAAAPQALETADCGRESEDGRCASAAAEESARGRAVGNAGRCGEKRKQMLRREGRERTEGSGAVEQEGADTDEEGDEVEAAVVADARGRDADHGDDLAADGAFSLASLEACVLAELLTGAPSLKFLAAAFESALHAAQQAIAYEAWPFSIRPGPPSVPPSPRSLGFSYEAPTSSLAKEAIFFLYAHVLFLSLRSLPGHGGGRGAGAARAQVAGDAPESGSERKRRKALERDLDRVLVRAVTQCPYSKRLWLLRLRRLASVRALRRASSSDSIRPSALVFFSPEDRKPPRKRVPVASAALPSVSSFASSRSSLPSDVDAEARTEPEGESARKAPPSERQGPFSSCGGERERKKTDTRGSAHHDAREQELAAVNLSLSADDEVFLQCLEDVWEKGIALNFDPLLGFV
ncbi:hypothetical protein BESB_013260 [Besnoitia besnoiti]|uniref:Uncharacterized protein n=1 Tax=Besnoitia besnoiti TaxID=94643 RepID=A0A2A9M699_BESBE|nr:hypothetical protein BESB_013260 [Besnoitia besnoiti]PFH32714.1 hypothetical protein BESB_013260 [Besnoitia besnoiti]